MASGLPDYYRGVDIAYQALSQMIVRPKYGGALTSQGGVAVGASATTTLVSIAGKGMTYGGIVFLMPAASQKTGFIKLSADGNLLADLTLENLNKFGVNKPRTYPIYLLSYDDVNHVYCIAVSDGITFETSLVLTYEEQEGATPTVFYHIAYALI